MSDEANLRDIARKRLKARQDFRNFAFVALGVCLIVTIVWWLSGAGYFWPGWVFGAMAISLFFSGLNAYGPNSNIITEAKVDEEVRKMQGGQ